MKLYSIVCDDAPGAPALRDEHIAAHLAHVEAHIERYAVAGPLKQDGATAASLLIVKAADEGDARAFLEADPYFAAGVWSAIRIEEFAAVAGEWVGGAAWKK